MIKKEDGKYIVRSKAKVKLGEHISKKKALAQLYAIEINKHRG